MTFLKSFRKYILQFRFLFMYRLLFSFRPWRLSIRPASFLLLVSFSSVYWYGRLQNIYCTGLFFILFLDPDGACDYILFFMVFIMIIPGMQRGLSCLHQPAYRWLSGFIFCSRFFSRIRLIYFLSSRVL